MFFTNTKHNLINKKTLWPSDTIRFLKKDIPVSRILSHTLRYALYHLSKLPTPPHKSCDYKTEQFLLL